MFGPSPQSPRQPKPNKTKVSSLSGGDWVLFCLAGAMGIGQMLLQLGQHNSRSIAIVLLLLMVALLIRPVLHLPWLAKAESAFKRIVRTVIAMALMLAAIGIFGWLSWPPLHRHELSKAEREKFEKPLAGLKQPKMSIHLYCAPYDETDCVYAAELIPLFGEAGWDVSTTVERITLGRPKPGIVIGLHGTLKPEDEPKLKWNEGEWAQVTPEEEVVRQAFVNIGIEPDSISGATIPENQINIYVGHERENESAPTDMTLSFENLERTRREHPEVQHGPGAK